MTITDQQIEARRKSIGGSDIGAILGENNYKTAYEVWEEKVEGKTIDLSRNKSVVIGNLLESALIEKYEKENNKICSYPETFHYKYCDFLSANLDGVSMLDDNGVGWALDPSAALAENRIIEIKTASCFNKDEWGPSGSQIIPKNYYAQIAHYMLVTGYKVADIFVGFIDDATVSDILCEMNFCHKNEKIPNYSEIVEKMETRLYTFNKDLEIESLILEGAVSFYNNHIRPWIEKGEKNPPPMDFSNKNFRECIKRKYSIVEDSEIRLPSEFIEIKNNYIEAMKQAKKFDEIAQKEKSKILASMGNNQKAILEDGSYFSRKTIKRKEYTVKESEYVKFEFKQPRKNKEEI